MGSPGHLAEENLVPSRDGLPFSTCKLCVPAGCALRPPVRSVRLPFCSGVAWCLRCFSCIQRGGWLRTLSLALETCALYKQCLTETTF